MVGYYFAPYIVKIVNFQLYLTFDNKEISLSMFEIDVNLMQHGGGGGGNHTISRSEMYGKDVHCFSL
jgi:hypothetical protein